MDREALSNQAQNEVSWKHQRDFFVTVVDPPAVSSTEDENSEPSCQECGVYTQHNLERWRRTE